MEDNKLPDDDTITLILSGNRILASKERLSHKSRYFECLFSDKFCDFTRKEIDINYDIQLETLQDFIDWTNSDVTIQFNDGHIIKTSLSKYVNGSYLPLLTLLEIGCTFIVDSLIGDVMDVLVHHWFEPEIVIDVWLMAQEISYTKLKDVAFAVCLDRFMELPTDALLKLSTEKFTQLIKNVNIRSTTCHLHSITKTWIEKNKHRVNLFCGIMSCTERSMKEWKLIVRYKGHSEHHNSADDIIDYEDLFENGCTFFREPVIWKLCPDSKDLHKSLGYIASENIDNKERKYIYYIDYLTFRPVPVELKNITVPFEKIKGMEVTGRGFSIYFIGGVYDFNSSDLGQFNMDIWRYCMLSEKMYYVARLPRPRKNLIACFMANKLMLVGGLGENGTNLTSIDVLNIHTGEWTHAADIPSPPLLFKNIGGSSQYKNYFCVYDQHDNKWSLSEDFNSMSLNYIPDKYYVGANDYEWPSAIRLAMYIECFGNDETSTVDGTASKLYWHEKYYLNYSIRIPRKVPLNEEGMSEKCVTEEFGKYWEVSRQLCENLNPASLYWQVTL